MTKSPTPLRPSAVVAELREEARRLRDSEAIPAALVARLLAPLRLPERAPLESLAAIISARPITDGGRGAMVRRLGKRVIRRTIAWYVRPIAEDQTAFNLGIVRELRTLQRRVDRLMPPPPSQSPVDGPARASAIAQVLADCPVPLGPVLLVGERLPMDLGERQLDVLGGDAIEALRARPAASCAAVIVAGAGAGLTARDLLELPSLVRRTLRSDAVVVIELGDHLAAHRSELEQLLLGSRLRALSAPATAPTLLAVQLSE